MILVAPNMPDDESFILFIPLFRAFWTNVSLQVPCFFPCRRNNKDNKNEHVWDVYSVLETLWGALHRLSYFVFTASLGAGTVITPIFLEPREACIHGILDLKDKDVNKHGALFSNSSHGTPVSHRCKKEWDTRVLCE